MNFRGVALLIVIGMVLGMLFLPSFVYVVDRRELVVVKKFGRVVAQHTEPGFNLKIPIIHEVVRLPRREQFWGGTQNEEIPNLPTSDAFKVEVIPWAIWKITDPKSFVSVLVDTDQAELRVKQIVRGAVRDTITQFSLADLVRSTSRELSFSFRAEASPLEGEMLVEKGSSDQGDPTLDAPTSVTLGRKGIIDQIRTKAIRDLASETDESGGSRGIELVDVGIAKIDFVPTVREAAFNRLIALMNASASYHTNEGERLKQEIINRTSAEVQRIQGEGKQQNSQIKGGADADVIRMYAEAMEQVGEFYSFIRTLEAYKKSLTKNSRFILSTNNEFFRLLKSVDGGSAP